VRHSSLFWKRMAKLEESEEVSIPEILSTHPASNKRALELEDLMTAVKY
jgi:predicted Zn-dependent protease